MLRFRRYRYYVFFAAVVVFLLYRVTKNSGEWEPNQKSIPFTKAPPKTYPENDNLVANKAAVPGKLDSKVTYNDNDSKDRNGLPQQILENTGKEHTEVKIPDSKTTQEETADELDLATAAAAAVEETQVLAYDREGAAKTTTAPLINIPDKNVGKGAKGAGKDGLVGPGGKQTKSETTPTSTVHWTKLPEHFPVPEADIIPLPTGNPKKIPALQYEFERESVEARNKREGRLDKVQAEMQRSWAGYMKYAKGHDELSPVSKTFRDPFCGWAATLVDTLDTLWIMGMKDEFEEALLEVEKIDFTTTSGHRTEIPVFETTIRYLGGLISAYDVSGGKAGGYDILLDKALELAEILMGVFDTPNRMPVLYYKWKPFFVAQPKRASASAGVAELGSLAMEFTRLAQITKENRFYDAVARITDAFYEWGERGTSIPGIFPEQVDATGCNRTAEAEVASMQSELEESQVLTDDTSTSELELEWDDEYAQSGNSKLEALEKRALDSGMSDSDSQDTTKTTKMTGSKSRPASSGNTVLKIPKKKLPECIPQGLDAGGWGSQHYSMGGSQDSTYEYFPKQWLLLGGLEPKYKTLYLKTVEAVKKWLLYRPMLPDDRDILFSAKINTQGDPMNDADAEYEVTHLTCFIGGMFGIGGKMFDIPEDVEIGKKLTDGCIWAYESTPSGVMPEGAHVVPCAKANDCHWNETLYWEWLDPLWETRPVQIEDYRQRKAELKEQNALEAKQHAIAASEELETDGRDLSETNGEWRKSSAAGEELGDVADKTHMKPKNLPASDGSAVQKRSLTSEYKFSGEDDSGSVAGPSNKESTVKGPLATDEESSSGATTVGMDNNQIPLEDDDDDELDDPLRPQSHEEYVKNRIENENLPPGYTDVNYRRYILRPEAIESVWYMYRITGDTYWQEKGWKMFNAIVKQTQTEVGNSAIDNVLMPNSDKVDEMESFWLAETLKYFYLLYSDPTLISLDEWVLNTEAHPFKRPT